MLELTIRRQAQGAPTQFQFENDLLERVIRDSAGSGPAYEGHPGTDGEALQLICITVLGSGVIVTPAELPKLSAAQKRGDGPRTPQPTEEQERFARDDASRPQAARDDNQAKSPQPYPQAVAAGAVRAQAPGIRTPIQETARRVEPTPAPKPATPEKK